MRKTGKPGKRSSLFSKISKPAFLPVMLTLMVNGATMDVVGGLSVFTGTRLILHAW